MEEQEQGQELEEGEEKKFGSRCSRWRLLWLLPACFCLLPPALGLLLLLLVLLVMLFCNPHAVVASRPWHQVLRGGEGFRRGRGRKRGELGVHHRDVVVAVPIA